MTAPRPNGRRRDDGSVLPLVLVLMIVAGLIVIPLLGYAVSVFRSNRVVSDRTGAVEAAKGGVRMAVGDPKYVFNTCDGGSDALALTDPVINGINVGLSCTELSQIGPNEAIGFEVPIGAVATQLGAAQRGTGVPVEFSGSTAQSPPVLAYPVADPDWWALQRSAAPTTSTIWLPDLPTLPGTPRTSTPFNMPAAFNCKVFFPGHYTTALTLTGNVYFASGVYYFEQPVNVLANANVVVGYGLKDLPNPDCSNDWQVVANVLGSPGTFDIFGGGATWVFGKDGRLLVDDAAATSIRLIFNQRYDEADRGGRISIMTVNGDDPVLPDVLGDHLVTNVNRVPISKILDVVDNPEPAPDTWNTSGIAGTLYSPSSSTYTDEARLPTVPTGFTAAPLRYFDPSEHGAILLTWNEVTGQAAGGAFIDGYNITINGSVPTGCQLATDLVVSVVAGVNKVSCLVKNLAFSTDYDVRVGARNSAGVGALATILDVRPRSSASGTPSTLIAVPAAPTNVAAVDSNVDDVAQVSWTTPANGGAPITSYLATAHRIYLQPQPNQAPVADAMTVYLSKGTALVTGVAAFDPNGDALSLTVNTTGFPATVGTVTVAGRDITISTLAGGTSGTYSFSYTVTDPFGLAVTRTISVVTTTSVPGPRVPIARSLTLAANVGVPITNRIPVYDPNGDGFTAFNVVGTGFAAPEWTFSVVGLDVTITTTAPNGTYTIPYNVTAAGQTVSSTIVVTVARGDETLGSCQVLAAPGVPLANVCEIAGLADLAPGTATSGNVGYRFDVTATNAVGTSPSGSSLPPLPLAFNGGGVALPPPAARTFEPWIPVPIIDIRTHNTRADVEVSIAGYVSVPMGRVAIDNPTTDRDNIKINGGILAGTYKVVDARAVLGTPGSLPIGFKNDIILQRKVKIVATAKNIRAIAVVQVNEDGAKIRINSWVIQ